MRLWLIVLVSLVAGSASAQYRSQKPETHANVSESVIKPSEGLLFGWLDPSRLSMHHSYSLSYSSFGGQGLSVGMYTNSLMYKFSDPLDVRFDVSLVHSPFGSSNFKDFSGVYLSRAELNYRPTDNMWLQVQFRQMPAMYWWGSGFSSGYFDRIPSSPHEEDR